MLSLRRRLALIHWGAILVIVAVAAVAGWWQLSRSVQGQLDAAHDLPRRVGGRIFSHRTRSFSNALECGIRALDFGSFRLHSSGGKRVPYLVETVIHASVVATVPHRVGALR